jgi:beta-mannanase
MVFTSWGDFVGEEVIKDVYTEGCVLMVTWEPWNPATQDPIDYDKMLSGGYDSYIASFAQALKNTDRLVLIRFAHEMNGDWYPWCGNRIGKEKYIALYRYAKDRFDAAGAKNVRWVFAVNWEDAPKYNNDFASYYPGDRYVDFIGIDGYNWGNVKSWSRWRSFKEIFEDRLNATGKTFNKPVIISEFGSTSSGGDKALWIKEAFLYIRARKDISAFVLFNVDKETDWSFPAGTEWGRELKSQLRGNHFVDSSNLPR